MRFGFVGPSYTLSSTAVADEECINFFPETVETQGSVSPAKAYGGQTAQGLRAYFATPGLAIFATLPSPVRGSWIANNRLFVVGGSQLIELDVNGIQTNRGTVANDAAAVSIVFNSIQLLIVSAGHAYCFDLSTNVLTEVTSLLAGVPMQCEYADTYFIVIFQNSNKFQLSQVLDGTTWPGQLVNEVSVFPENIQSMRVNHRELWVGGLYHYQPYQDTGSANVFDVIPGALIETGAAATFGSVRLDNSVFWINQDERGARMAFRSNGYTPQRISTHAIEYDLAQYSETQIANLVSYTCQIQGHLWWVLYIPNSSWSWVYDVSEGLWFKMAFWTASNGPFTAHRSWNHVYAFGMHLVGDWNTGNLYQMHLPVNNGDGSYSFVDDFGTAIRRVRRAPTIIDEKRRVKHAQLWIDVQTGLGPQPPLQDGEGNPRPPQAMLRWSKDRGQTWGPELQRDCGFSGEYNQIVRWQRLPLARNLVYEFSVSDPIPWAINDAYLDLEQATS